MKKNIALLAAAVAAVASARFAAAATAPPPTIDGTVNSGEYEGPPPVYQNNPTGFGNNSNELDSAHFEYEPGGNLYLGMPGNLSTNNTLVLFIDSKLGGAVNSGVPGGFNNFSHPGGTPENAGIRTRHWNNATIAPGFNPDFALELTRNDTGYFFDVIDLQAQSGDANRKIFIANFATASGPYSGLGATTYARDGGTTAAGVIEHHLDNSNTAGVTSTDASDAASATTGWEFSFDPTFLGYTPGTALRMMAAIQNSSDFLSNQFLPGLGGTAGNIGTGKFNAQIFGDQSYLEAFVPENSAGGTWDTPANWTGGATPNGAEHSAALNGTTAQTVDLTAGGVSLGYLKLDNPAGYTIQTGALNLDGGLGAAILISTAGSHTITSDIQFLDDTRVRVSAGSSITIQNGYTLQAGQRISKAGLGSLTLNGALDNGAGSSLAIDGGDVTITTDMGAVNAKPDVYVGGAGSVASVNFTVAQNLNALAANGQGTIPLEVAINTKSLYVNGGTINGTAGTITMADGGVPDSQLNADGGKGDGHVNVPVTMSNNVSATIHGGSQIFLDGPLSLAAGARITKHSTGWLTLTGPQSHGNDPQIAINNGQVALGSNFGAGLASGERPRIFVSTETAGNFGQLRIDANQTLERIRVNTDGLVTITANGNRLLELDTIFIMPTGKVDIKDNKMLLHGGDADNVLGTWNGSAYDGISGRIAMGRGTGIFDGTEGIVTTMAPATDGSNYRSIGIAKASDIGMTGQSFGGVVAAADDLLVSYVFNGDTNLNGKVDADDYFAIDSNYNKWDDLNDDDVIDAGESAFGWYRGDFTYDGKIDGDDYAAIDAGYSAQFLPGPIAGAAPVPEPAGFTLLAIGAVAGLARRRRRAQ